jgi:acetylornithine deacetylase/succinyl-diaminopimelate desuccinylase-like protein
VQDVLDSKVNFSSVLGESQSNPSFTRPDSAIVRSLSESVSKIAKGIPAPLTFLTQGTSDANIYGMHSIDTCLYGPGTFKNIHGYDESVSIADTIFTTQAYLQTVVEYVGSRDKHAG